MLFDRRVEALVGQADISEVALGHGHTLFLDSQGAVFSCGNDYQARHFCIANPFCGYMSCLRSDIDAHEEQLSLLLQCLSWSRSIRSILLLALKSTPY